MAAHVVPFGDLLRRHRRDRQFTQEDLAERAGVSARTISDLERGLRAHPYRETAHLLANALHLSGEERATFLAVAGSALRTEATAKARDTLLRVPHPLTPLIGRDTDMAVITSAIRDEHRRLVTLTGPGGVGKSRLAVAAAARLAQTFADGALFVDLAPLTSGEQMAVAIATALGATSSGSVPPLEVAQRVLASRQLLLVFDSFEHLLADAPMVSDILEGAPGVTAIVTSRAALRLRGEREIVLPPLPTPAGGAWQSLDDLASWEAIRLFVARAQEGHPAFTLTDENANAVAAICQRLDGLPLAIELAASRIRTLAPGALLARIDARLPVLTRGARDAPPRHQTLEAAIAWGYDLLTPDEQALFRSLAIFSGGWTLEAAEEIGQAAGLADPLEALGTLCDHHLVMRDDAGREPRYRMLDTLRAYALDRLVVAGEEERARQMHLCYLEHLARDSDLERLDAGVEKRFQRLQAELPNLRTGINWAITHDQAAALRILAALGPFWMDADLASEGCDLHLRVLSTSAAPGSPVQTRVLGQVACLYAYTGEFAAAAPWVDAALALAHDRDDEWAIAHVLITQNGIAMSQGDEQRARVLLEEAMARFQALDDSWGIFAALNELGIAAMDSGDHEAALGYFTRLRAFAEERGLTGSYRAQVLVNLADAYRLLGAFGEVEGLCTEILAMPDLTRPSIVAIAQQNLGYVCLHRGEVSRAADLIRQSLDVFWQIGDWWNVAPLLESAALVMHVHGDSAPSVRSFAAASTLREAMPYPLSAVLQDDVDKYLLASRAALGDAAYAAAWATGTTERLDAAVIFARNTLLELCDARDSRQVSEG